ncbi:hypothetical protein PanWU01x14_124790, partial [Parasponia andersonii]
PPAHLLLLPRCQWLLPHHCPQLCLLANPQARLARDSVAPTLLPGIFDDRPRSIVVGGIRFILNLVDIENRLTVETYNPDSDSWDLFPPLPMDFRFGNSPQSLSLAL